METKRWNERKGSKKGYATNFCTNSPDVTSRFADYLRVVNLGFSFLRIEILFRSSFFYCLQTTQPISSPTKNAGFSEAHCFLPRIYECVSSRYLTGYKSMLKFWFLEFWTATTSLFGDLSISDLYLESRSDIFCTHDTAKTQGAPLSWSTVCLPSSLNEPKIPTTWGAMSTKEGGSHNHAGTSSRYKRFLTRRWENNDAILSALCCVSSHLRECRDECYTMNVSK